MMKTRQEMIYEFMVALAAGFSTNEDPMRPVDVDCILKGAEDLADAYIQYSSGNY